MKIGIRATLQALLEADDLLRGTVPRSTSLGATLLTLVRRFKATQAAATDLRAGLQRLKEELNEVNRAEATAHAAALGARDACENLRAQITVLRDERNEWSDAYNQARKEAVEERDAARADVARLTLELGQACAAGETLQRSLDLARMDRDTQAERANTLAEVPLHRFTSSDHGNETCMRCGIHMGDIAAGGLCV